MSEKPIIFSGEMVRAVLDGRKTQTRRVIKYADGNIPTLPDDVEDGWPVAYFEARDECDFLPCPYGQPGDRLWVRETFGWFGNIMAGSYGYVPPATPEYPPHVLREGVRRPVVYKADHPKHRFNPGDSGWKPSIHMPRTASRITLEITGIRVERVQDISEADIVAEGVDVPDQKFVVPRQVFADLWDRINAKRGYGWDVNPLVWVIEFRRIEPQ